MQSLEPRRMLALTPIGAETTVPLPAPATLFDIAVAGNGTFLVAAASPFADGGSSVVVQRYSADGHRVGDLARAAFDGPCIGLSAAMDTDGNAVLAVTTRFSKGEKIYYWRLFKTGGIGTTVLVAKDSQGSDSPDQIGDAKVSMNASGGFYLAYIHSLSRDDHLVRVRAYNAQGKLRGPEFTAARIFSPSSDMEGLALDARDDGSGATIAYAYVHSDSEAQSIDAVQVSATKALGLPVRVDTLAGPGLGNENVFLPTPAVAANADQTYWVSYQQGPNLTFVKKFNAAGKVVGETNDLVGSQPLMTGLADGGYVIDVSGYVRQYSARGTLVDGVPLGSIHTAIGADALGRVVLANQSDEGGDVGFQRLPDELAVMKGRELYVLGKDEAETIRVSVDGGRLVVHMEGAFRTFDASAVEGISINGFGGNDLIVNETDVPCTLVGGDGRDTLRGGGGDDQLRGQRGNDSLAGGSGGDIILGGGGADSISGNAGSDYIQGGSENDRLSGQGGRDTLFGAEGDDRIFGGASGDYLVGQEGNDQLFGEEGDDELQGNEGVDTLYGGDGNDLLTSTNDDKDFVFGDSGRDTSHGDSLDELTSIEVKEPA
jgi:hypothetical protein